MASGWAADGAVQDQIDSTVDDAVQRARQALGHGESEHYCQECGEEIPLARRQALQGVRYCLNCQSALDKKTRRRQFIQPPRQQRQPTTLIPAGQGLLTGFFCAATSPALRQKVRFSYQY
ncbi:DnaK suppressor protein [Serratia rubidaea]|uniref:DnaK suppressor protein n=1 Tax=Serratia rubidaea TaxID=61652 RepID=A0A4U9HC94_SERRU|nr:DnaK suppressor protein [Serratia rubidaea]